MVPEPLLRPLPNPDAGRSFARRRAARRLSVVGVFVAGLLLSGWLMSRLADEGIQARRDHVAHLAIDLGEDIARGVITSLSSAYALAAMVKVGDGRFDSFEAVAEQMLGLYPGVAAVALAPGGVVRRIYPLLGNEAAIGHDLLTDTKRNKEAILARDTGQLTLAGPFEMVQGGIGAVGRFPVFVKQPDGGQRFWGLVAVVLRFPEVLKPIGLAEVSARGYDFALWRVHPDTGQRQMIVGSEAAFRPGAGEYSLSVPNGSWTLTIHPQGGFVRWSEVILFALVALLVASSLAGIAWFVTGLADRRAELERVVGQRTAQLEYALSSLRDTDHAMSSVGIGAFWLDGEAVEVLLFNRGLRQMLGLADEARPGLHVRDFAPDGGQSLSGALRAAEDACSTVHVETVFRTTAGQHLPVEVVAFRMAPHEHSPARWICFCFDITQRKDVLIALQRAKEAAEAADRASSSLLANARHEFLTPLNGILGMTAVLLRRADDDSLRRQLGTIQTSGRRLLNLVNQMLELAMLDAGGMKLVDAPFSLAQAAAEWEAATRPRATAKGLGFEVVLGGGAIGRTCIADARCLGRIVGLLLDNAVKFTHSGIVELAVRLDEESSGRGACTVSVRDTGVGVSIENRARLFQAFGQVDASPARGFEGLGLGLALALRLVQLLGGKLELMPGDGPGSTFRVHVPLTLSDSAQPSGAC